MKISILTLFPEMFDALKSSIIGRAAQNKLIEISVVNIRDFSLDKHSKCDDYPFGGGAGMVMTPQPIVSAVEAVDPDHKALRIYMSPKGERLSNALAQKLSEREGGLLILCGHYEGVDQRALDLTMDAEISIGDYVLTGGELAAMVVVDCVSRFVDGVLGSSQSYMDESFSDALLEYPQYTRPAEFRGVKVPEVLLSGHHENVTRWRQEQSESLTKKLRPDLWSSRKKS